MNTETTGKDARAGWVFYDAECRFCVAGMKRWGGLFARRGFAWLPLQTPGTAARLGVSETQLLEEMWLQRADGRVAAGVNACAVLMRSVWWLWPLGVLLAVPGINAIGQFVYRWVARNRHCLGGSCRIHTHRPAGIRAVDLLGLGLVMGVVVFVGRAWPAWVLMWAMAVALGTFIKWLAWRDARSLGSETPFGRTVAWFLLWPGMDGRAFFADRRSADRRVRETGNDGLELADSAVRAPAGEWFAAFFKLGLGIALIWFVGPRWLSGQPLAFGWCGMIGIVFMLHFGLFHVMSLAWRRGGVNAAPIMDRPLVAASLGQFWGQRWNTAFSIPARRLLLLPWGRRIGLSAATFGVFAVSGLLHDLIISIPARAGYGLPTVYFLLQGLGVSVERSRLGRTLGLGAGICGRLFTIVVAAGPVCLNVHPPFIRNVIVPMFDALGAR